MGAAGVVLLLGLCAAAGAGAAPSSRIRQELRYASDVRRPESMPVGTFRLDIVSKMTLNSVSSGGDNSNGGSNNKINIKNSNNNNNQNGDNHNGGGNVDSGNNGGNGDSNRDNPCEETWFKYPVCTSCNQDRSMEVTVYGKDTQQRWEGWGTNIAWSARWLAEQPKAFQDTVNDLLFDSEKGLGLSIVRYTIPASYNPVSQKRAPEFTKYISQGFVPSQPSNINDVSTWRFDWGQDREQRAMVTAAKQRGVKKFEAISYSPPWWLTINGDVTGASGGCGDGCNYVKPNLEWKNIGAFAKYLAQVAKHFNETWGITFTGISPFNEPMEGWWFQGCKHEACSMEASGIMDTSVQLRLELDNLGLNQVEVTSADSWADKTWNILSDDHKDKLWSLSRLGIHGYRTPNSGRTDWDNDHYSSIRSKAQQLGKPIHQTEWGPMNGEMEIPGFSDLDAALLMSRSIIQHINIMGSTAWLYWLAYQPCVGPCGWWGMVQTGPSKSSPRLTKQYHAMKHFAKWIPERAYILGMKRECHHSIVASYTRRKRRFAVTVVNQKDVEAKLQLCFDGLRKRSTKSRCTLYRTSATQDYQQLDCDALKGVKRGDTIPCFTATIPPASISTWVFGPVSREVNTK